ncbi:hypothetical protein [Candidatus Nitrospira nitrosa]|nr:hypothetical protein [Candidatus Nitrospira nitrosa]
MVILSTQELGLERRRPKLTLPQAWLYLQQVAPVEWKRFLMERQEEVEE